MRMPTFYESTVKFEKQKILCRQKQQTLLQYHIQIKAHNLLDYKDDKYT